MVVESPAAKLLVVTAEEPAVGCFGETLDGDDLAVAVGLAVVIGLATFGDALALFPECCCGGCAPVRPTPCRGLRSLTALVRVSKGPRVVSMGRFTQPLSVRAATFDGGLEDERLESVGGGKRAGTSSCDAKL